MAKKAQLLETERAQLIEVAIKCQEAQMKLRNVYEKFSKETDLVRLLFGDLTYPTALRGKSLEGQFNKQSGSNAKKWEMRHFVLNDHFVLFYVDRKDKEPRGIIRMDQVRAVERVDANAIGGRKHVFKVCMNSGKEFVMEANNDEECGKWVTTLARIAGW